MLKWENLTFGYKGTPFCQPFSGIIDSGQVLFLLGPNGSGKTTLLQTLCGILGPISGVIEFGFTTRTWMDSHLPLYLDLTVSDIITITQEQVSKKSLNYFNELQIEELKNKNFLQLSSGEKKRLRLLIFLNQKSPYVFLDEPLSFLDNDFSNQLHLIIKKELQKSKIFVIANHDLNWCLHFPKSRAIILQKNSLPQNLTLLPITNALRLINFKNGPHIEGLDSDKDNE